MGGRVLATPVQGTVPPAPQATMRGRVGAPQTLKTPPPPKRPFLSLKIEKTGARAPKLGTFARAPLRGALAYVGDLRGSEGRQQARKSACGRRGVEHRPAPLAGTSRTVGPGGVAPWRLGSILHPHTLPKSNRLRKYKIFAL